MNFDQYVTLAGRTAKMSDDLLFNLNHAALGVAGEAGEFVDSVKKSLIYNRPVDTENLQEELGDMLWYIALAAASLGVSLDKIAADNIAKLQKRYPEKYTDELAAARLDKQ
jgi:NTP pyrophosphatase (non-canonical NTP hydrolase)